ncbi:acyl-CoA synthetase [uncultured Pseudacidovorax sp.]|uniref:acyl-CoA synthetase n=1 Tax=uncultured Pseudacidovorax sp. TaxID=679313 RepID=UPI0025F04334|nr:acyl-CoA synthetase [uncultured Pseudacidovorax sp.]
MSAVGDDLRPAGTDWVKAPERSNMLALRVICALALWCGRPLTRLILHPITLYFLLFSPTQRRHVRRYLARAIGPRAGWRDGYRLLHNFASIVLDRVYFLRGRMGLFDVQVQGGEAVEAEVRAGRGAFLVGAHIGSFEALSACRQQAEAPVDLRLAMLMYPDNARRINAVLEAISLPEYRPHVIALGRPAAMLELRDWLDGGRMAGMLGDRTLAIGEDDGAQRGNRVQIDFLGQPAWFNDGPFRLAALLRRPAVFMAGLYLGGNRYQVVFEPLADFSAPAAATAPAPGGADAAAPRRARGLDPAERERRIREALETYVRRLEDLCRAHPHNWFNFHDFWLEDSPRG